MAEIQESLPLEAPKAPNRFVIPDDEVPLKSEVEVVAPVAESLPKETNTEEAAPSAEPEAKPEPELTPEQLAAKRERRAQNKLEKAYRVRAEALAKADLLEKRLAELESKSSTPPAQPGEPRLEQFDYDPEKYATAKAEFAKTQAAKEIEAKQRTESQQAAQKKLTSDWETKAERGADKYDDWQDKVGDLKPTAPFVAALMKAGNGDDIAYHLGSHPKEAQRIASLEPIEQFLEIGLLSAKLSAKPVEPKVPSKAPAPITPVAGTASALSENIQTEDDYGKWFKMRQKQVHGKR